MVAELLVVGGGKMGMALVGGLLGAGWARPEQVVVTEVSAARRSELTAAAGPASRYPGLEVLAGELPPAKGVVVAVKPADVEGVCCNLTGPEHNRVLSIAAGAHLGDLESWCPRELAVVRAMPNMGALVGAGATAIAGGRRACAADMAWAAGIMRSVGTVVEVAEHLLDAVTGVSGSGPAYVFLVAEAMTEAGVLMGLPRSVACDLVAQTLLGSARLLRETGESASELRAAVTSPGGTTAAGLRRLEAGAARSLFIEAVAAATQRSRELGPPGHSAREIPATSEHRAGLGAPG
jgi:pyrroline-5-carboxylate reductase